MKTYIKEELNEILELHQKWLNDEDGGVRASLYGANLHEANLHEANLHEANLRGANLSGANLSRAYLSRANLHEADLRGANLSGANLCEADLSRAVGNLRHIKSLQVEKYYVTYTSEVLQIGCQRYTIEEWKEFDDCTISKMDNGALEWWNKWKPIIMQIIEMSPAEPTGANNG